MAYMEFPGVNYTEKDWDSSSAIVGGATDTCGVIIIAEKGPINKPTMVNSIDQAIEKFGSYIDDAFGMYSIRGFFQNGGRSLYVSRVAHYLDITDESTLTAKIATLALKDRRETGAEDTISFSDKTPGTLGNTYGVKIVDAHRVSVVSIKATVVGDTAIDVKAVRDFAVGDWVCISDTTNKSYAKIENIDSANRRLNLDSKLDNVFEIGRASCRERVYEAV